MEEKRKHIPFDVNVALQIKNKLVRGFFVKRNGELVNWLTDNVLTPETWNEVHGKQLFYQDKNNFISYFTTDINGLFDNENGQNQNDVFIILEDNPNKVFIPTRFQSCVVRNNEDKVWRIAVKTGNLPFIGTNVFYEDVDEEEDTFVQRPFSECLPLNEETVKLVGTKKPYKK